MSDIVELKVTSRKPYTFYLRSAKHFVEGTKVKAPVEKITVSALGNAIPAAITIASKLEQEESATIENVTTGYPTLDGKEGQTGKPCAQIKIVLKRTGKVTTALETEEEWETAERLKDAKLEKKMAKVKKEGGKRGVEIEGAADMGGLQFFCTAVLEPGSDVDMLVECMKAMNAKPDPNNEEERKGGSGHVGKLLFTQSDKAVAIMTYVPKAKQGQIKANEWLSHVVKQMGAADVKIEERSTATNATVAIECNADKGLFAIKMKDAAIQEGINYLKERGLFPDKDDDEEDEMVFGDDDFPM
jgi:hypothetical protein